MRLWLIPMLLGSTAWADVSGRVWSGDHPAVRAVVLFSPVGAPARSRQKKARLNEVWLSFVPKVQVVPPGSTLILSDHDDESHTVHAWLNGITLFNLASVPREAAQRIVLDRPGVVTITCDLHKEMRAFIVVSSSRYSAVTDLDGRFRVDAPAGSYQVQVWRPDGSDGNGRDLGMQQLGKEIELRLLPPHKN
jgi:plastocyanin